MNILETIKKEGYYRIFQHDWNRDIEITVRKLLKTNEVEFIELPFYWGYLRYLFLRNGKDTEIVTVMFKIPINFIPYEEIWSKWGKRRKKKLNEFLMAWVLKHRVDENSLKEYHACYTYRYAIVSVPRFLKSRLFAYLKAFGIIFKEVTPEYHYIDCQNCNNQFRFRTESSIKKSECPYCNAVSFVR